VRLPDAPIICCISEGRANADNFREVRSSILEKIKIASRFSVNIFQIREKSLTAEQLFDLTSSAVDAANGQVLIFLNDRVDIALAAGAAGVHLPSCGLPVDWVRRHVGSGLLIGVSTHSMEEAVSARDSGADYAAFGPVFESPGKGNGVGMMELASVCAAAAPMPVLALGGIEEKQANEAIRSGAAGFAAIRHLNKLLEPK